MAYVLLKTLGVRWFDLLLGAVVIAAAIATLTVLTSVNASAESQVHDLAHRLGKNMLVVPAGTSLTAFYGMSYGDASMPAALPERILSSDLAEHISSAQARLYGNVDANGVPIVLGGEAARARGQPPTEGAAAEVVLGRTAARRLGVEAGAYVVIGTARLRVARVTDTPPDGLDLAAFTSLATAQQILGRPDAINALRLAGCWCRIDVPTLAAKVERRFPGTRAVTVAGVMKAQTGTVAAARRYSKVLTAGAGALIAGIVALLGAAQVRRQRREIGLLIAIGARARLVVLLFLVEAVLLGAAGAIGGYLAGHPLTAFYTARLVGLPLPVVPGQFVPLAALAVLMSLVGTAVPALWAARLDPTTVLREV
ncbi:MAG: ABC transporter permease [Deltaproteobacteria bacterium]|nr:ABC transporter permease [Deltaproteobacteria bacterium]